MEIQVTSSRAGFCVLGGFGFGLFKENEAEQDLAGADAVQAREDDLEDLRSERLAIVRIASLNPTTTISLEEMLARTNCYPL